MASAQRQVSVARLCLVVAAIVGHAASSVEGGNTVLFSKLPKALIVTATLPGGGPVTEVTVGRETILVTWKANTTSQAGVPVSATKVRTKLCFATESQTQRAWRATEDDLSKDKTCLYDIAVAGYAPAGASTKVVLPKNIPGAKYFVRAYAVDVNGVQIAYGQSSPDKAVNTFSVVPISGRSGGLNAAVAVMSVTSVVLLFSFFIFESLYLKREKRV